MEQRKYSDIVRMGHRESVGVAKEGDYITVYEKLDGANASFRNIDDEVIAYSRNTQLSSENGLRGFYEWARSFLSANLPPNLIYYGEWLVKHKVDYGQNAATFYLFDIYDVNAGEYTAPAYVIAEAARLGITVAPILYAGPYVSFEHIQSFVGRSALAVSPTGGEGVVVKNVGFRDKYGNQTYLKLVSEGFREVQPQKAPRDPNAIDPEAVFVSQFMTEGRVDKLLRKLVDESIIPESFGLEDMGTILKELGGRVYVDLMKEESNSLPADFEERAIRKAIGKTLPLAVKSILISEVA